jgi:hypothetical protein
MTVITEAQDNNFHKNQTMPFQGNSSHLTDNESTEPSHTQQTSFDNNHKPENSNKTEKIFHNQTQRVLKLRIKWTVRSASLALSLPAMSAQLTEHSMISLLRHHSLIIQIYVQHCTQYLKLIEFKMFTFQQNKCKSLVSA